MQVLSRTCLRHEAAGYAFITTGPSEHAAGLTPYFATHFSEILSPFQKFFLAVPPHRSTRVAVEKSYKHTRLSPHDTSMKKVNEHVLSKRVAA